MWKCNVKDYGVAVSSYCRRSGEGRSDNVVTSPFSPTKFFPYSMYCTNTHYIGCRVSVYSGRVSAANLHSPSYYLRPSDEAGIELVTGWASASSRWDDYVEPNNSFAGDSIQLNFSAANRYANPCQKPFHTAKKS